MPSPLALTLLNDLGEVIAGQAALTTFLDEMGLDSGTAGLAHLVFEEIVTNVVKYGFPPGTTGEIHVRVEVDTGRLRMCFENRGVAFDPTTYPTPEKAPSLRESRVGGLGLHLVRELSEEFTYRRKGGSNLVAVSLRTDPGAQ